MVAATVAAAVKQSGASVSVFKPAVTGLDELTDKPADHLFLKLAAASTQSDNEVAPYRYRIPASPHLAAQIEDPQIDKELLLKAANSAVESAEFCVIEGVGGLMAPLSSDYLVRDFAIDLGFPVVVVARPGLGTINHAVLTVKALREANLQLKAVVMTPWSEIPTQIERSNLKTVEELCQCEVLTLPQIPGDVLAEPTPENLCDYGMKHLSMLLPIN